MKRIIIALMALILVASSTLFFVGCSGDPAETEQNTAKETDPTDNDSESETEGGTEAEPGSADMDVHEIVKDGKVNYSIVRPDELADTTVKSISGVYTLLQTYTTDFVDYSTDNSVEFIQTGTHDESRLEIIIGRTNYKGSDESLEGVGYGDYVITTIGNKIYVNAWAEELLFVAVEDFCARLADKYDSATGSLSVTAEELECVKTADERLNEFVSYDGGELTDIYDCGNNSDLFVMRNATKESFDAYLEKLASNGYTEHGRNEMQGNLFATYVNADNIVSVIYSPYNNDARVIIDSTKETTLYPIEEPCEKICDPMIFQVGVSPTCEGYEPHGMCYMIRLEDGSFIVFDGGFAYNSNATPRENAKRIYDIVIANTPEGCTPTIKAWELTHAHHDHHGAFETFLKTYDESMIKLEYFIHNFPAKSQFELTDNAYVKSEWFRSQVKVAFPSCKEVKVHAGQELRLGNVTMEIIFTLELYAPKSIDYLNTSSIVSKLYFGDQTLLMTGDMYESANRIICDMYGDYIKSDFCQVAHHGYNGGSDEFYKLVKPSWVLWPINEGETNNVMSHKRNKYLATSSDIKQRFFAHWVTTQFTLPYDGVSHVIIPNS